MQTEILEFIRSTYGTEVGELYEESFELFSHFNLEDYISPYTEIYMLIDDYDYGYINTLFNNTLFNHLLDLVKIHGIFVIDSITSRDMVNILSAISKLEEYEDTNAIINILEADTSDEAKLCDIFYLVSNVASEDYLSVIESLNPGLIRSIHELFKDRLDATDCVPDEDVEDIRNKAQWVKKLYSFKDRDFKDCKVSVLYPKLQEGLQFNMEFSFYCKYLNDQLGELSIHDFARDLVGMSAISIDQSDRVLENIKQYLSMNIHDIDQSARIMDIATRHYLLSKQDNGIYKGAM